MGQNSQKNIWSSKEIAKDYLQGTRAAIPLAYEQIRIIMKVITYTQTNGNSILDIGCGDGILGRTILSQFPNAKLTLTDFSETMLAAAKIENEKAKIASNVNYIEADMSDSGWMNKIEQYGPFDVIISGLAIHHLTHFRKKRIYAEIYDILTHEGIFLNLDRVESQSSLGEKLNSNNYIDSLFDFHKKSNPSVSRDEIAQKYFYRSLKQSNILAPVELQTSWLRELGFKNVDIFFKVFEIAIFGGTKRALDA